MRSSYKTVGRKKKPLNGGGGQSGRAEMGGIDMHMFFCSSVHT